MEEVQECEEDRSGIGQLSLKLILTDYAIHKIYKGQKMKWHHMHETVSPEAKIKATNDVISVYNMKTRTLK